MRHGVIMRVVVARSDFFRYTDAGARQIFLEAGFVIEELNKVGDSTLASGYALSFGTGDFNRHHLWHNAAQRHKCNRTGPEPVAVRVNRARRAQAVLSERDPRHGKVGRNSRSREAWAHCGMAMWGLAGLVWHRPAACRPWE